MAHYNLRKSFHTVWTSNGLVLLWSCVSSATPSCFQVFSVQYDLWGIFATSSGTLCPSCEPQALLGLWQILIHILCCNYCCVLSFLFMPQPLACALSKTQLPPRLHHMSICHHNPQASSGTALNIKNITTGLGQLWATSCSSVLGSLITCLLCSCIFFLGICCWPLLLLKSEHYSLVLAGFTHNWICICWFLGQHESLDVEWVTQVFYSLSPQITDGEMREVLGNDPGCCFSIQFKSLNLWSASVVAGAPDSTWLKKWSTVPGELQSGFQRARLGLATWLSTAGYCSSYSAAATTHTDNCELNGSPFDSVLLLSFSCVRKQTLCTSAINKWFVFNCTYLN